MPLSSGRNRELSQETRAAGGGAPSTPTLGVPGARTPFACDARRHPETPPRAERCAPREGSGGGRSGRALRAGGERLCPSGRGSARLFQELGGGGSARAAGCAWRKGVRAAAG